MRKLHYLLFVLLIMTVAFVSAGCHKKPTPIEPPAPPPAPAAPETPTPPPLEPKQLEEGTITDEVIAECTKQLQPVFYDFDKSDIRQDQVQALQNNARVLKAGQCANVKLLIEGHCDERGTEEYNMALGERRAGAAKDYMVNLGITEDRVSTISYGKDRPFAQGHNEEAWRQNRRAQFVALKK